MADMTLSTKHLLNGAHAVHSLQKAAGDVSTCSLKSHLGRHLPSLRSTSRKSVHPTIEHWKSRLTASPAERAKKTLHTICHGGLDSEFFFTHDIPEDKEGNTMVRMEKLQTLLNRAVNTEDYSVAARLRDELRNMQEDNEIGVLVANKKFYKAFERADLTAMRQLWAKSDNVQCIHPGCNCIAGYDMVMSSWETVLGHDGEQRLKVDIEDVRVQACGNMGFVTCVEVMSSTYRSGRVVATNVFQRQGGEWYIVHHHGSSG